MDHIITQRLEKPQTLGVDLSRLPPSLQPLVEERRWVIWRWEHIPARQRWTKVPYQPERPKCKARSDDPSTWGDHTTAVALVKARRADGVGFVLHGSDIAAFDLDDCRNPETGEIANWARELVSEAASYTEVTVSGTGLRIIGKASGAHVHRNQKVHPGPGSIETYRRASRYIVITGVEFGGSAGALTNIDAVIDRTVARLEAQANRAASRSCDVSGEDLPVELQQLIRHGVPEGQRSEQFHRIVGWLQSFGWDGDAIERLLQQHPTGIAAKYQTRLRSEIERSLTKIRDGSHFGLALTPGAPGASPNMLPLFWHGENNGRVARSWLIEEVLPETGKGLLSGQWGTGKTFVALDLSAAIMTGETFAGRRVLRQGGVLFIAAEGANEIPIRLRGLAERKLAQSNSGLSFTKLQRLPFAWAEECLPLANDETIEVLVATAEAAAKRMQEEHQLPLALIVIDTLAATAGFTDENNAAEGQRIMARLEELSRRTGSFVLAVDHFGKIAETGTRGTSAKEAAADVVIALLADRGVSGSVSNTRMAIRKLRGGSTGSEIPYTLNVVALDATDAAPQATTCVIEWGVPTGSTAQKPQKDRWPNSLRVFKSAIYTALIEDGQDLRPYGAEGPLVKAVPTAKVRHEFMASYPADGNTPQKQSDAKRQAYRRAIKDAIGRSLVTCREIQGVDYLWLVREDDKDIHGVDGQDTF